MVALASSTHQVLLSSLNNVERPPRARPSPAPPVLGVGKLKVGAKDTGHRVGEGGGAQIVGSQ